MNGKINNEDVLFDRLVDGELSTSERRTLLESLDARKDGWRKCALAFLEAQSWRETSRGLVAKSQAAVQAAQSDGEAKISRAPSGSRKRISMKLVAEWMAIAAAVVVAFRMGALQHGAGGAAGPMQKQFASALPMLPGVAPARSAAKPSDALNLWVVDDSGKPKRVRVPLVDASALDPDLGVQFATGVPDDVRNRLRDQGYTVQSKRQFAPMWLDNGRPMIVPVEDTKIVPVSNRVY